MFQGCFSEVSWRFQGSFEGVSGMFKGCFKEDSIFKIEEHFKEIFKEVSMVSERSSKSVSEKLT